MSSSSTQQLQHPTLRTASNDPSSSAASTPAPVPLYGNRVYKRQKTANESSSLSLSASSITSAAVLVFDKLKAEDPVHKQRIVTRQKAILKGKNTAGYDAYIQEVPIQQRRPRSMETPSTPDPTLDIPAKRWQGMVKAWSVARMYLAPYSHHIVVGSILTNLVHDSFFSCFYAGASLCTSSILPIWSTPVVPPRDPRHNPTNRRRLLESPRWHRRRLLSPHQ